MPQLPIRVRSGVWECAVVGTTETTAVINVYAGEIVHNVVAVPMRAAAASTSSTVEVGDGTDTDGFVTSAQYDPEAATVGTPILGAGAFTTNSFGKIYTAADTIDVKYVNASATGALPKMRVYAYISRVAPE